MASVTITRDIEIIVSSSSLLATYAAMLAPGQSVCVPANMGPARAFVPEEWGTVQSNNAILMWTGSGFYDPVSKEVGYIGKKAGPEDIVNGVKIPTLFKWLVYDEVNDVWHSNRTMWDPASTGEGGHGYDACCIDPDGNVYERKFGFKYIWKWTKATRTWSQIGHTTNNWAAVGSLSWWPGHGLVTSDYSRAYLLKGDGTWLPISNNGVNNTDIFSEYNSTLDCVVFGGGDEDLARYEIYRVDYTGPGTGYLGNGYTTSIAVGYPPMDPTFRISTSTNISFTNPSPPPTFLQIPAAIAVSDPSSGSLICARKNAADWYRYDIAADAWHALTRVSGDGSTPSNGAPNMSYVSLGVTLEEYGCTMWIQGTTTPDLNGKMWLYKHA